MEEHNFPLDEFIERLAEKRDDPIMGSGVENTVPLDLIRVADEKNTAIQTAIDDVKDAIRGAKLMRTRPVAA
ncbi:hypothetical protein HFO56_23155 [Rhizobium laguerreae]|uniref:hypothetical protein n=1 Tax=Rhizobium laguerreae TaxID=1076926 RepID=UPI001C917014|nr:hypothetical protein [Rhizobium laguerreae]MBY3155224.1 hypothetical protein [Rhizobium laguerreae]